MSLCRSDSLSADLRNHYSIVFIFIYIVIYLLFIFFAGADENKSLVNNTSNTPRPSVVSVRMVAAAAANKLPRNCSQPVMAQDPTKFIPKNGSVPNFERRYSKVDIANHMKVILCSYLYFI